MPNGIYNAQASTVMYRGRNKGTMVGITSMSNGLRASRLGMMIASENGANANTEGYTRRSVLLRPNDIRCVVADLLRMSDELACDDLRKANASAEYYRTVSEKLGLLEKYITPANPGQAPDDPVEDTGAGDIGAALNAVRLSLGNLASDKDNIVRKQEVRDSVGALIGVIKRTSELVENTRRQLTTSIEDQVVRTNDILGQIRDLNQKIFFAEGSGKPAFALEDAREQLLKELASYIPVDVEHTVVDVNGCPMRTCVVRLRSTEPLHEAGGVAVMPTPEERTLVDGRGRVATARFDVDAATGIVSYTSAGRVAANGAVLPGVAVGNTDNGGAIGGRRAAGFDFQNYLQRSFALGGSLSASINAVHGLDNGDAARADVSFANISEYKVFLDTLANQLVESFNIANAANGGADLLQGADVANLAISDGWAAAPAVLLALNVDDLCGCMDQTHNALNVIDGRDHSFKEFFDALVVGLGRDISGLNSRFKAENDRLEIAKDTLESVAGVNLQESITDIGTFKAIYQFVQNALQVQMQMIDLAANLLRA